MPQWGSVKIIKNDILLAVAKWAKAVRIRRLSSMPPIMQAAFTDSVNLFCFQNSSSLTVFYIDKSQASFAIRHSAS